MVSIFFDAERLAGFLLAKAHRAFSAPMLLEGELGHLLLPLAVVIRQHLDVVAVDLASDLPVGLFLAGSGISSRKLPPETPDSPGKSPKPAPSPDLTSGTP